MEMNGSSGSNPRQRNVEQINKNRDAGAKKVNASESSSLVGHPQGDAVVLRRQIGVFGCIFFTVGTVIGSGIFISPKGVLENTGSVGWALVIWATCGVLSTIGALCYAELGTTFTKSGGDYVFLLENFGPLPAFLRIWTSIVAVRTANNVVLAITSATYLLIPFYADCDEPPRNAVRWIAAILLLSIFALNCVSVVWSTRVQALFTIAKVAGLAVIALSGLVLLIQGNTQNFQNAFAGAVDPTKLPLAFYSGLFAYSGWQFLPQITEEVIRPSKNLPIGIVSSLLSITIIYMLTNVAYFTVLTAGEILDSNAVALDYGQRVLGIWWWTMSVAVTLSCIGSINGGLFSVSRMFFVASREGQLPKLFSMIHLRWKTPLPAAALLLPICLLMVIAEDIYSLINYFSFMRWAFIGLSVAAIPYGRWKYPDLKRPFKVPLILPIIFILACMFVVSVSLYSAPVDCGIGLALTVAGVPVYYFGVWWENKPAWMTDAMDSFTMAMQKLLLVVPQEKSTEDILKEDEST